VNFSHRFEFLIVENELQTFSKSKPRLREVP
jgi:hypothetical protein